MLFRSFLVSLTPDATKIESVDFNVIRWEQCELTLSSNIRTLSELQQVLVDHITSSIGSIQAAAKQIIMRVNVQGRSPLKKQLELDSNCTFLEEIIKDKTGLLDFEIKSRNLSNHYDLEELSGENTILSQMIKRISDETYEKDLMEKIVELPIFDGKMTRQDKEAYLLAMKTQLLQEVIERMVVRLDEN